MSYQLKIKYRQGNSIGCTTVTAEGTTESAAKACNGKKKFKLF